MRSFLRYGADASVEFDLADNVLVTECGMPPIVPLDDVPSAVGRALAEPLDYPPLGLSTTPGDRVLIAMEERVPQGGRIAAELIRVLTDAGVHADGVTVLRTAEDGAKGAGDPRPWLPEGLRERITVVEHDPGDRDKIAYLAADDDGEPILLNRLMTDADVVLPIGCLRDWPTAGYYGIQTSVYPTFSDDRTLARFRAADVAGHGGRRHKHLRKEADHVGWLLGVMFTVQVVPGPGDRLLHVLAGEAGAVRRRGRKLYEAAWRGAAPQRASLVVAAIEGGAEQQTWQNVGRALALASGVVEDGGAIALCCELDSAPGPAITQISTAHDWAEALDEIRSQCPADAVPASQLVEALERASVYLLSRLDEALVEELEIAPLAHAAELQRLAQRHPSCILLSNASHAMVHAKEDAEE